MLRDEIAAAAAYTEARSVITCSDYLAADAAIAVFKGKLRSHAMMELLGEAVHRREGANAPYNYEAKREAEGRAVLMTEAIIKELERKQ